MGIGIEVIDEEGSQIAGVQDVQNLLHPLLEKITAPRLLGYIDWYGDTIFNRLQIPAVRAELADLGMNIDQVGARQLLKEIDELAKMALEEPHQYLRFSGD
jgi:hypothetical protein